MPPSRTLKCVFAALTCAVAATACTKNEAPAAPIHSAAQKPAAPAPVPPALVAEKPAEEPQPAEKKNPLDGMWIVYSEVMSLSDINHNRNLKSTDGKPIYSFTVTVPQAIINTLGDMMQQRNKLMLDFMEKCVGTQNTADLAAISEGKILFQTTPVKLGHTIEITHMDNDAKNFVRDAAFNCQDKSGKATVDQEIATFKASVAKHR